VRDAGGEAQWRRQTGSTATLQSANTRSPNTSTDRPTGRHTSEHRTSKKAFWQSHWDGRAWAEGKPPGPKIPYRLPELAERPVNPVYIVEGEKDADRPAGLGLVATTSSEGAEKWTRELNQHFRGRHVFVLPDNDDPGRKHGRQVAENLQGIAETVTVVELPGLPPKGDVSVGSMPAARSRRSASLRPGQRNG
jgi:5S rRNA maturation endonuclease (ribonuclease M5)